MQQAMLGCTPILHLITSVTSASCSMWEDVERVGSRPERLPVPADQRCSAAAAARVPAALCSHAPAGLCRRRQHCAAQGGPPPRPPAANPDTPAHWQMCHLHLHNRVSSKAGHCFRFGLPPCFLCPQPSFKVFHLVHVPKSFRVVAASAACRAGWLARSTREMSWWPQR